MEVPQSPFLTQSQWSSGSTVCFSLEGATVHAPGVQPTLEPGILVSVVSLHWYFCNFQTCPVCWQGSFLA